MAVSTTTSQGGSFQNMRSPKATQAGRRDADPESIEGVRARYVSDHIIAE